MTGLRAMAWQGGKSAKRRDGNGQWIASLLPPVTPGQVYAETFAGMLGVLLSRTPAFCEVANDLDGRLLNWWRAVRDNPAAFARAIALTPNSRRAHREALARLDACPSRTGMAAAIDLTIGVLQSFGRTAAHNPSGIWLQRDSVGGQWHGGLPKRVAALAERISNVALEEGDAVPLTASLAHKPNCVMYLDPPYDGTTGYAASLDRDALLAVLTDAPAARIAISGYDDEWDALLGAGWRREQRIATRTGYALRAASYRVESLWMNYPPTGQGRLL